MGRAVHWDASVSACAFDDCHEKGSSGLPNLALVNGSLDEAQRLKDGVFRDSRRQPSVVAFALGVLQDREHLVYQDFTFVVRRGLMAVT